MTEAERSPVLVRGAGDVGSAVATVLFRAGYAVALHDEPAPAAPRRGMAFADAVLMAPRSSTALPLCASIPRPNCGTH
jgi:2-polyprenyl-6-methoxyphenol hydroxylase-like FAD-dependent oxidoreductase